MRFSAILRPLLATGTIALSLTLGTAGPAVSEPMSVPFAPEVGETATYAVRYLRAAKLNGQGEPVVSVEYNLDLTIDEATGDGFRATVLNRAMDISVDLKRVIAPPDFDTLLLAAVSGMTAEVEISNTGALEKIANWDDLKGPVAEKAHELAGGRAALTQTVDAFLPTVSDVDAIQLFARPLAMGAPGRIVTFDPPKELSVTAGNIELPSFASYAAGNWSFDLMPRPEEDYVTVQWLGVPGREELKTILANIGDQLDRLSPLTEEQRNAIDRDGRMWQRFSATYDEESGKLLAFQGVMELQAGPLARRVGLEAGVTRR